MLNLFDIKGIIALTIEKRCGGSMKLRIKAAAVVLSSIVAGCTTTKFSDLKPIAQEDIYKVVAEVKRQISVYTAYQDSELGYPSIIATSKVCGNGRIGFDIVAVRMELVSSANSSVSGGISGGTNTVGLKVGGGNAVNNSQGLILLEKVSPSTRAMAYQPGSLETAPLAQSMVNLWDAARRTGDDLSDICLSLIDAEGDANTYTMAITVTKTANGNVSVGLAEVGLAVSGEFKSTTGNTVTVKFVPHDFSRRKPPRPKPGTGHDNDGQHMHVDG